jgi:putative two-component system response regulator
MQYHPVHMATPTDPPDSADALAQALKEQTGNRDVAILAVSSLAATRASDTGNHTRRIQFYVRALARQVRKYPQFAPDLSDEAIDLLFRTAPFHDIGTIGIPDRILLKPSRFEPHEFEIMKTHTTLGRDAIAMAEQALGFSSPFLSLAKEVTYAHQERWDGSGYPMGLVGYDIPLSARLMAVADVYDALISSRVYRDGMPHPDAFAIVVEGKGSLFDPDIVDCFVAIEAKFQEIVRRFPDSQGDIDKKIDYMATAIAEDL